MKLPRKTKKALKKFLSNTMLSNNEIKRVKSIFPYDDWKNCVSNRIGPWSLSVCGTRHFMLTRMIYRPSQDKMVESIYNEWLGKVGLI